MLVALLTSLTGGSPSVLPWLMWVWSVFPFPRHTMPWFSLYWQSWFAVNEMTLILCTHVLYCVHVGWGYLWSVWRQKRIEWHLPTTWVSFSNANVRFVDEQTCTVGLGIGWSSHSLGRHFMPMYMYMHMCHIFSVVNIAQVNISFKNWQKNSNYAHF